MTITFGHSISDIVAFMIPELDDISDSASGHFSLFFLLSFIIFFLGLRIPSAEQQNSRRKSPGLLARLINNEY